MGFIIHSIYLYMLNITKKIVGEPLFHFLLFGALAYFYFDHFQEVQTTNSKPTIIIENYELSSAEKETNIKNPLLALEYLKYKKILLEEAYSLHLYKEDTKINELLLTKMEYLFKTKQFTEPSEEQLKQFYNEHISDYSQIKSLNLYTIKLDREGNFKVLKKLSVIADLTPLAKKYERLTPDIIEKKFGKYIALKLYELPQGLWSEPINNTIFFITKKEVLHPYPFEEIEGIVYENYKKSLAVEYAQKEYAKIYNKYKIIEPNR